MGYEKCRTCEANIKWITTANGKRMPLDVDPIKAWTKDKNGKWHLTECFTSHFVTCPQSKSWSLRSIVRGPDRDTSAERNPDE